MPLVRSVRAQKIVEAPRFFKHEKESQMRKYPGGLVLWAHLEWDGINVKKLSFYGELASGHLALLESMASLVVGRPVTRLDDLTIRECEAFLRDKNSEPAVTDLSPEDETNLRKVFHWLRAWPRLEGTEPYAFEMEKGAFRHLKIVDKVREVKAFLNSPEIASLYENYPRPTVVDVDDLTVYIQAPYESQREKALFDELHRLGVSTFREEELNFIPEAP